MDICQCLLDLSLIAYHGITDKDNNPTQISTSLSLGNQSITFNRANWQEAWHLHCLPRCRTGALPRNPKTDAREWFSNRSFTSKTCYFFRFLKNIFCENSFSIRLYVVFSHLSSPVKKEKKLRTGNQSVQIRFIQGKITHEHSLGAYSALIRVFGCGPQKLRQQM